MITVQLSNSMAEKLWRKLSRKQNPIWGYLRDRLMASTGFPMVIEEVKEKNIARSNYVKNATCEVSSKGFKGWVIMLFEVLFKHKVHFSLQQFLDELEKGGKNANAIQKQSTDHR